MRPYLERMTRSELFALMTVGMATVAGSVLVAYAACSAASYAGHLVTASLLSAPAAILIAKVMVPETETPETVGPAGALVPRTHGERDRRRRGGRRSRACGSRPTSARCWSRSSR